MSILVHTEYTHLGDVNRVIRMAVGMLVIIGCAIAAAKLTSLVSGIWFAVAMWPAAYLMFTGFTGFDPLSAPHKTQKTCKMPFIPAGPYCAFG